MENGLEKDWKWKKIREKLERRKGRNKRENKTEKKRRKKHRKGDWSIIAEGLIWQVQYSQPRIALAYRTIKENGN